MAERLRKLADSANELAERLRDGRVRLTDIGKLRTFSRGEPVCVVGVLINNAGLKRLLASRVGVAPARLNIGENEDALKMLGIPEEFFHKSEDEFEQSKFSLALDEVTNINDSDYENERLKEMPKALIALSKTLRRASDRLFKELET